MNGHKVLWDAAMKPLLDAWTRCDAVSLHNAGRFDPIELPFARNCDGDRAGRLTAFSEKDGLS